MILAAPSPPNIPISNQGKRALVSFQTLSSASVKAERERLQISTEITLPEDLSLEQAAGHLPHLAEDLWRQITRKNVEAKGVTLKLKTHDFRIITRSLTYSSVLPDTDALLCAAQTLMQRVPPQREDAFRLIGIGVNHLVPKDQQQSLWL